MQKGIPLPTSSTALLPLLMQRSKPVISLMVKETFSRSLPVSAKPMRSMLPSPSSGKPTRFSGLPRNSSTVRPNLPMPTTMPICSRMAVSCTTRNSSRRSSRGRTTRRRWRRSLVSQVLRSSSWLRNRICSMDMTACLTKKEFNSIVSSLLC